MKKTIFTLIVTLLLFLNLYGGDTYNYDVTTIRTYKTRAVFWGLVDMSSDSIGNHYTQWIDITDFADYNAMCWAVVTAAPGTEDVNVTAQYSANGDSTSEGILAGSAIDGLDALTITPKRDTINVITGANDLSYESARYMRLMFDGQAGNPETTVYWQVIMRRNPEYTNDKPRLHVIESRSAIP